MSRLGFFPAIFALLLVFLASVSAAVTTEYCEQGDNCIQTTLEPMTNEAGTPTATFYLTKPTTATIKEYPLTVVRYNIPRRVEGFFTRNVNAREEQYMVETVLAPPASCQDETGRTRVAITTTVTAYVPPVATAMVTPFSSGVTPIYDNFVQTVYYLRQGDAPAKEAVFDSGYGDPYYYCSEFPWEDGKPDSPRSDFGWDSPDRTSDDSYLDDLVGDIDIDKYKDTTRTINNGISSLSDYFERQEEQRRQNRMIIIIAAAVYIGIMFLCGFVESFVNFTKMMRGHEHRGTGVPYCWVLMVGLVPGLIYYCVVSKNKRKMMPLAINKEMEKEFSKMGFGTKLGLWLKYGLWNKRPPCLEEVELRVTEERQRAAVKETASVDTASTSNAGVASPPLVAPEGAAGEPKENFSRAV